MPALVPDTVPEGQAVLLNGVLYKPVGRKPETMDWYSEDWDAKRRAATGARRSPVPPLNLGGLFDGVDGSEPPRRGQGKSPDDALSKTKQYQLILTKN